MIKITQMTKHVLSFLLVCGLGMGVCSESGTQISSVSKAAIPAPTAEPTPTPTEVPVPPAPTAVPAKVGKAVIVSVTPTDSRTLRVVWKQMAGVSGYELYQSTKANSGYKKIATAPATSQSWMKTGLTKHKNYYYKVRAFVDADGKKTYGEYSEAKAGMPKVTSPMFLSINVSSYGHMKLCWTINHDGNGYQIFRSEGDNKHFKRVKTITEKAKTSIILGGMTLGKKYFFTIRAIKIKSSGNLYGPFSASKAKMMNYYTYDAETMAKREKRVFGKAGHVHKYGSQAEAQKHMKAIVVKTWDISNGKKVTRTFSIMVHKKLARSIKKIFAEIYAGKEKFPIHSLGGYSWRGDSSKSEHCIGSALDINPTENYYIKGKTVLSGKFWKPGSNPYSIPTNGEVAKIMKKYGFYQGSWGSTKDYMHFSYFKT